MASEEAGMTFAQLHTLADAVCGLQAAWANYLGPRPLRGRGCGRKA